MKLATLLQYAQVLCKSSRQDNFAMVTVPYRKDKDLPNSHWPPSPDLTSNWEANTTLRDELTAHAKAESDRIDKELLAEKARMNRAVVKILLLGQSESGKSTTLRNFQLTLAPKAFQADAEAWRTVIHLNLVISVNCLLDILKNACQTLTDSDQRISIHDRQDANNYRLVESQVSGLTHASTTADVRNSAETAGSRVPLQQSYSTELRRMIMSFLPLRSIEDTLRKRLGAEASPEKVKVDQEAVKTRERRGLIRTASSHIRAPDAIPKTTPTKSGSTEVKNRKSLGIRRHRASSSAAASSVSSSVQSVSDSSAKLQNYRDVFDLDTSEATNPVSVSPSSVSDMVDSFVVKVRGSTDWRRRARLPPNPRSEPGATPNVGRTSFSAASNRPSFDEVTELEERELSSARQIIEVFGSDIDRLWRNEEVQAILATEQVRLDKRPGFFLDDVLRVTAPDYIPSTSDILHARLTTTGVEEHRLVLENGRDAGQEWIIYDVGGYRSQRTAWAPYFDSMDAIIFLAPISSFDEWLVEDPTVNRLEDTFHLWTSICANRLLQDVDFMLFLNKFDILCEKIRSGIRFSDFVINYDDKNGSKNDPESIARHLLSAFHEVHKNLSPKKRKLRAYLTSVIDAKATSKVVAHVKEQLLIGNLEAANIL